MRRREFIAALGSVAFCCPRASRTQQDRMRRVAILMNGPDSWHPFEAGFIDALRKLGWVEGYNLKTDLRWNGDAAHSSDDATELVRLGPDAILVASSPNLKAAQAVTRSIPLVFVLVSDPVAQGFVANLARPGGNTTGFAAYEFSIGGKWLALLRTVAPNLARVAVVFGSEPQSQFFLRSITAAAPASGIEIAAAPVRNLDEIAGALEDISHGPSSGLIFPTGQLPEANGDAIADLAARYHLPAIYASGLLAAEQGGLMAYTSDPGEQFRGAAAYVDRILKGEKPADLPVQFPVKYELVINLKAAKEQGFAIPPTLLATADRVIE